MEKSSIFETENERNHCYLGRSWLSCVNYSQHSHQESLNETRLDSTNAFKIKFMTYHILADYKCQLLSYCTVKEWTYRRQRLLSEIVSVDAHILCLQDVDHYDQFWQLSLLRYGYDSIFCKRSNERSIHYEGVLIAFKRDLFNVFKVVPIYLNHAAEGYNDRGLAFKERCISDDVGLIVFLQPKLSSFQSNTFDKIPNAICVATVMLNEDYNCDDIRLIQSIYFLSQIEMANKDFLAPVLLGINMNGNPRSASYHLFRTGRTPLQGDVPRKCKPPTGTATCRGSVRLFWKPPMKTDADPDIISFKIAWRPGGSLILGFDSQITMIYEDCIQYKSEYDDKGTKRVVIRDELSCVITGLASEIPYEFRICAVNSIGDGLWSDASDPIVMHTPDNFTENIVLPSMKTLPQVMELREQLKMGLMDTNANHAHLSTALNSLTNLSPRQIDGKMLTEIPKTSVLPVDVNPRTGWKPHLHGGPSPELTTALNQPSVLIKSNIRDIYGHYLPNYCDTGTLLCEDSWDQNRFESSSFSLHLSQVNEESLSVHSSTTPSSDEDFFLESKKASLEESIKNNESSISSQSVMNESKLIVLSKLLKFQQNYSLFNENTTILDCKDIIHHIGIKNNRQVHSLSLRSAYESYSTGGEPIYTSSVPIHNHHEKNNFTDCLDYIFYTNHNFVVSQLLSIPLLIHQRGNDPSEPTVTMDLLLFRPSHLMKPLFNQHESILINNGNLLSKENGQDDNKQHESKRSSVIGRRQSLEGRLVASSRDNHIGSILFHNSQNTNTNQIELKQRFKENLKKVLQKSLSTTGLVIPYPTLTQASTDTIANQDNFKNKIQIEGNIKSPTANRKVYANRKNSMELEKDRLNRRSELYQKNSFWGGYYASAFPTNNIYKESLSLPNELYCSTHIALCAEFIFK